MTKRESILLKVLLLLITLVTFYFFISIKKTNIRDSKSQIQKYEKTIKDLENKKNNNLTQEIQTIPVYNQYTLSEITDELLTLFTKANIKPERYQLNKNNVDFTISCPVSNFLRFLMYSENKTYPYTLKNCSLKSEKGNIRATLSYTNNYCEISQENSISYSRLLNIFPKAEIVEEIQQNVEEQPVIQEKVQDGNNTFKVIGFTTENDIQYLYVKNINTSRMIKIQKQNIIEETSSYYILEINNIKYRLQK